MKAVLTFTASGKDAASQDTGLANLPSAEFKINQAWLALVLVAGDLLAWTKGLLLEGTRSVEQREAQPLRLGQGELA